MRDSVLIIGSPAQSAYPTATIFQTRDFSDTGLPGLVHHAWPIASRTCIKPGIRPQHNPAMSKVIPLPPRPSRLSAKLRAAIDVRVTEGLSIVESCAKAGLSPQGWHKAMKRPAVRNHLEVVQRRFVAESDAKRALYRARAFEVALDLMLTAKSEAIRARMAEFLASDGKAPQVAVHVDARAVERGGYEFVRPGQKLVELTDEPQGDESAG